MKKKAVLAVLAMCITLTASACNSEKTENTDDTRQEAAAEQESTKKETAKKGSSETRLVSVDDIEKYITIGEYKGIALDNMVQEVTDEEIEAEIEYQLDGKREEVTDGSVQDGDLVTINFVGTRDGETFDGGTANNYDLTIGEGGMIDGFEDGIIGMKKGETKELNLTFPEDYGVDELDGQPVVFKITLQTIRRAPELTDEWVSKNMDAANVEEYRANVRKQLEEDAKVYAKSELYATGWAAVLENSEMIEYPQEDVDNAMSEFRKLNEEYAAQADMTIEEFIEAQGFTEDTFEDESRQYAEGKVKQNLIVQSIMDAEGLSLEDEESLALQEQLIENYGAEDLADLIDMYGQIAIDEAIGLMRVETFIVDNAKITEKVANGDVIGENADIEAADDMEGIGDGTEEEAEEIPAEAVEEPEEAVEEREETDEMQEEEPEVTVNESGEGA